MFLEKAIYSSQAKSNTKNQELTRPAVALIVEAGKLISDSIPNNTTKYALSYYNVFINTESCILFCRRGSHFSQTFVCS